MSRRLTGSVGLYTRRHADSAGRYALEQGLQALLT